MLHLFDSYPPITPDGGGGVGGGSPFPYQAQLNVQVIPGVGGSASGSTGGSGRASGTSGMASAKLFFVDDYNGTSVSSSTYGGYSNVLHGTVRGAAALTGPRFLIFTKEGTIDLGGSDIRFGSEVTLCGQFAPGLGVAFINGQISTATLFGSPAASNQVYMHITVAPGDGAASVAGSENWDGIQFAGGDNTGANAPDLIFLTNVATHHCNDESWDGYYLSPTSRISAVSCVISRALGKSTHTEGGLPGNHPYGVIIGDGKKAGAFDMQRCYFGHLAARQPMVAADKLNIANCIIANPGDTELNIAQGIRPSNDYGAASPNTGAMKGNFVGNVFIKGNNGYPSFYAICCDPSGSDTTTRLTSSSKGYVGHNAAVGFSYASQDALRNPNFPAGYASAFMPEAWTFSIASDLSDVLLPAASEKSPNAYTYAEIKNVTDPVLACLGPRPSLRSGTIHAKDVAEYTAMLDNTAGKGNCINSVSGTEPVTGANPWPNTSFRYAPNDGGLPSFGSATTSIDSIIATYFPLVGGNPDNSIVTTGTFVNGRSKALHSGFEVGALTKHFEVGGQ